MLMVLLFPVLISMGKLDLMFLSMLNFIWFHSASIFANSGLLGSIVIVLEIAVNTEHGLNLRLSSDL